MLKVGLRLVIGVGIVVITLILVMGIGGMMLPRRHHVARVAMFAAPRDSVWAVITDMEHSPGWRTDVTGVRRLADRDGHPVWMQVTKEGNWPLEITVADAPARLVAVVADSSAGFGGTWTYDLAPAGSGTRVTIAEDGFVSNPFFRFMARFFFGLSTGIDNYLVALGRRFGEYVKPSAVESV